MSFRGASSGLAVRRKTRGALVLGVLAAALVPAGSAFAAGAAGADVDISLAASPDPVAAGEGYAYFVDVYNDGPDTATSVTFRVDLPAGATFLSASTACAAPVSGSVSCTLTSIAAFEMKDVTINLRAPNTAGVVRAVAEITQSAPADPDGSNNRHTHEAEVLTTADVNVWTSAPDTARGGQAPFTVTVANDGPKAATNVVTTIDFEGAATIGTSSASPAGTSCARASDTQIRCTTASLPRDGVVTITVPTQAPGTNGGVTARAQATASSPADAIPENNADAHTAVVGDPQRADLGVSLDGPAEATVGREHAYDLLVENSGPATVSSARITTTLPAAMRYLRHSAGATCSHTSGTVTCDVGALASETVAQITIYVEPLSAGTVTASARVAGQGAVDPEPDSNAATARTTVRAPGVADLALLVAGPETGGVGLEHPYTFRVRNFGPSDGGARVSSTLPGSVEFVRAAADSGECSYAPAQRQVTCTALAVPAGASAAVEIVVRPTAAGPVTIAGTATGAGADPDPTNDSSSTTTQVLAPGSADLAVTVHASLDPATLGERLAYSFRVENLGPFPASGASLSATLPAAATVAGIARATHGSCAPPNGRLLTCSFGTLEAGDVALVVVPMTPTASGSIAASATRGMASGTDPVSSNDSASVTIRARANVGDDPVVSATTGAITRNPETGETVFVLPRDDLSAVDFSVRLCPAGGTASSTSVAFGSRPYALEPRAGGRHGVTIPAADVTGGRLVVSASCGAAVLPNEVARVELFEPIGVVRDTSTGLPVEGASVELFRVPGWRARTRAGDTAPGTCESGLSKASSAPWSQPAPTGLGVRAEATDGRIDPGVNPTSTNAQGRFGWSLAAGCWYAVVSRAGYEPRTTPVVGVPSAVTGLDVSLDAALSATTAPSVGGDAREGQTLTGSLGTWRGYPAPTYARQWLRCDAAGGNCIEIAGAAGPSYALTSADIGTTLRFAVTATNSYRSKQEVSGATSVVVPAPPRATAAPSIAGRARVGETLVAAAGAWASSTDVTFAYAWERCRGSSCVPLPGATGPTLRLTSSLAGAPVRVVVIATNSGGSGSAASALTAPVAAVDRTPPTTRITGGPLPSARALRPRFRFVSSERPARFQCRLDAGRWTACVSGRALAAVARGRHTLRVRAIDAAGNVDRTPAIRTWRRG